MNRIQDWRSAPSLSPEQERRLSDLLDQYLTVLETGRRPDLDTLLADHTDLSRPFQAYVQQLDALYGLVPSDATDRPQQTFGDFRILAPIGRGGMGVVYEAEQQSLRRRVALKILPMLASFDAVQVARFQNEARAAGLLDHPHIVPVLSIGVEHGTHFFAMQLIDGASLDRLHGGHVHPDEDSTGTASDLSQPDELPSPPPIAWQTVATWGVAIADALHHAHERGVIHRDVKPSNLIVDDRGKVWITDFGLAHGNCNVTLTASGQMLGTVRYMSPEQARGQSAQVDGRCDVYSLAVTLYELLAGHPAFDANTVTEVLQQIDGAAAPALHRLRRDIPRDLSTVIAKGMAARRDQRYDTAEELAKDLQCVLEGRPTQARPPTLVDRLLRSAAQHRRVALGAAILCVLAGVTLTFATILFASLQQEAEFNSARAMAQARLARTAVDRLGVDTAELLAGVPHARRLRARLLTETLDYYLRFAAETGHDPDRAHDLAITYGKIGGLYRDLEQPQPALEALQKSEQLFAHLQGAAGESEGLQLQWAQALNELGQGYLAVEDSEAAGRCFARAIRCAHTVGAGSDRPAFEHLLATAHHQLGRLLADSGALAEAENHFRQALALTEGPVAGSRVPSFAHPTPTIHHSVSLHRARICRDLGQLLMASRQQEACQWFQLSLNLLEGITRENPNAVRVTEELVVTLHKLAGVREGTGQSREATQALRRAVELASQLQQRMPASRHYLRLAMITRNQLGRALAKQGLLIDSANELQLAAGLGLELNALSTNQPASQQLVACVHHNLSQVEHDLGRHEEARRHLQQAIHMQRQVIQALPQQPDHQKTLQFYLGLMQSWLAARDEGAGPSTFPCDRLHAPAARTIEGLS